MKTALLLAFTLLIAPALVGAQTVVQKNGVPVFTTTGGAPAVTGNTYNFRDAVSPPGVCVPDPSRVRATTMSVGYGGVANAGNVVADMTQFASMYGRATPTTQPPFLTFPKISGIGPTYRWTQRGIYTAQAFVAPTSGVWTGSLAVQSNNSRGCFNTNGTPGPCGQPFVDISISETCNDFSASAAFVSLHTASDGQPHFRWWQGVSAPGLRPGVPYFLNVRMSDPLDYWRSVFVIWYGNQVGG